MKRTVLVTGAIAASASQSFGNSPSLVNSVLLGSRDLNAGDAAAAPLRRVGHDVSAGPC